MVALINAAFLTLVFFLVTTATTPSLHGEVDLMPTAATERSAPRDALFVTRDGELRTGGETTDAAAFLEKLRAGGAARGEIEVKLAADRNLPAARLIEVVDELRRAGATRVSIVTEFAAE